MLYTKCGGDYSKCAMVFKSLNQRQKKQNIFEVKLTNKQANNWTENTISFMWITKTLLLNIRQKAGPNL